MHPVLVCSAGGVTEPWPKQGLTRCLASICGAKDGKLLSWSCAHHCGRGELSTLLHLHRFLWPTADAHVANRVVAR